MLLSPFALATATRHAALPSKSAESGARRLSVKCSLANFATGTTDEPKILKPQPIAPHCQDAGSPTNCAQSKIIDKNALILPEPRGVRDRDHVKTVGLEFHCECARPSRAQALRPIADSTQTCASIDLPGVNPMEVNMTYLQRREVVFGLAGVAVAQTLFGRAGAALAADKIKPSASSALIVVDVQNCFLPGGSLAVKNGDQVIPVINRIAKDFENVIMTQDWHTAHHVSFASSHAGKKPFEVIKLAYGNQVLWPDHCVQGTEGAQIAKEINIPQAELIIRKGFHNDVDSYSAFLEADKETHTGLAGYLKERGDRHRLYHRSCHRFLRGVDGDRRSSCGIDGLCRGRRLSRDRYQRVDRQGLGRHDGGRRQKDPVERSGLNRSD